MAVIEKELHSDALKQWAVRELTPLISGFDTNSLAAPIEKEIKTYVCSTDLQPLLLEAKAYALENRFTQNALNYIISEGEKWAEQEDTKSVVGNAVMKLLNGIETEGLLKLAFSGLKMLLNGEKLGAMLQPIMISKIRELRDDGNEIRQMILGEVDGEINNALESEQLMGEINNWKNEAVGNFDLSEKIADILTEQKNRLVAMFQNEDSMEQEVFPYIQNFMGTIISSPEKIEKIESWVHELIYGIVDANHSKIGKLVKENLDKLDDKTLVNMMENNLGADLQWIRVNGAVCGFLIGIVLSLVKMFV
jgi:uncharacterized membrane-anchored protein YjiN (DUF445 family)